MRPVLRVSSLAVLLLALTAIACYDAVGLAPTELHPVAVVAIQPAHASVNIGETISFSAVALDASGNPVAGEQVTWRSRDTSIASVSTAGAVTPKHPGATVITASTTDKTADAALTVLPAPVAAVELSSASAIITVDDTVRLAATMRDDAGNTLEDRKVGWTSADTTIATVSSAGLVTGVAKGHTIVTATSEGVSDTTGVTVVLTPPSVASVSVAPTTKSLVPGATVQLSATAKDTSGSALSGHTVTWTTSSAAVATVSSAGLVKAVAVGNATITATVDGKTGTAAIKVALVPVATISVSPTSANLSIGGTQQLTSTVKDGAGNTLAGRTVVWTTSDTAVATVTTSGLVTAIAAGSATVTASSEGKTVTASITVIDPSPPPPTGTHAGWYVSPNGSANGDGSAARPWDLVTAMAGPPKVQPGDTLWLRGGTYWHGDDINRPISVLLQGTQSQPIIIRQYPGERATIDGNLEVSGSYVWLWGFEVANTRTDPDAYNANGVDSHCTGCRFINLVVHDHGGAGFGLWQEGPNQEAYGNIVYNNGFHGSTDVSYSHGIYAQNITGTKRLADNIVFDQFGYGIHIYAERGSLIGFIIEGNAVANSGTMQTRHAANILVGGSTPADDIIVRDNMTYQTNDDTPGIWLGHDKTVQNGTMSMTDNYIGNSYPSIRLYNWTNATVKGNIAYTAGGAGSMADIAGSLTGFQWSGNSYYGDPAQQSWLWAHDGDIAGYTFGDWKAATGLSAGESYLGTTPPNAIFVRPNEYEPGRANIIVYNWADKGSVTVDVSRVLQVGAHYEVRDAQNFYGPPVTSGTYGGGSITLPMAPTQGPPSVSSNGLTPPTTGPVFGMFVVLSTK